jgi:hypothetical protein
MAEGPLGTAEPSRMCSERRPVRSWRQDTPRDDKPEVASLSWTAPRTVADHRIRAAAGGAQPDRPGRKGTSDSPVMTR